jgi:hypothetical protein
MTFPPDLAELRRRRDVDDLIARTPADGLIAATLTAATARGELPPLRRFVDTW